MKTNIKLNKLPAAVFLCFLLTGCGKLQGSFAYKHKLDDHYKKLPAGILEVKDTEPVYWLYTFKKNTKRYKIAIITMKKELVWVDIQTKTDYIDAKKNTVYGSIEGLQAGDYYLLLTNLSNKKIIDKFYFTVFTEQTN